MVAISSFVRCSVLEFDSHLGADDRKGGSSREQLGAKELSHAHAFVILPCFQRPFHSHSILHCNVQQKGHLSMSQVQLNREIIAAPTAACLLSLCRSKIKATLLQLTVCCLIDSLCLQKLIDELASIFCWRALPRTWSSVQIHFDWDIENIWKHMKTWKRCRFLRKWTVWT